MIKKIIFWILISLVTISSVYANESVIDNVAEDLELEEVLDALEEFSDDTIDVESTVKKLITGNGTDYGKIGNYILEKLLYEVKLGIKSAATILVIIILMALIKGLELEKDNNLSNVTNLVGFLIIATIMLKSYLVMIKLFVDTIQLLTQIMQVISPFMLAILIATGEITTSGIIGPVLMFVTSLIGIIVTYVIVPLLSLSLVFKIITNISENIKLDNFSSLFSSASMWIISVIFALFLGVLELESTVTTSVDEITIKTTQAAVSNLVPVVGKFVSDSIEVVMGASQVIGKAVGVVGIMVMVLMALVPIIKLIIYNIIYFIAACFSELLNVDSKITKLLENISKQYKTMMGIMLGVMITFIIGIAIVINLMGKVIS